MNLDLVILDVPIVGRGIRIQILFRDVAEQIARDAGFTQQVLALVRLFHQLAAQTINRLTLLVHHVVVLEQVLARFEVAAFHRFLRRFNALRNHPRFDRHAVLHAEALHQRFDLVAGKDAHQIVFERKEEARRSWIALPARATAKLIVDAA